MLRALTRKFALAADVDLGAVAAECAPTFTGADLYALAADAWTSALYRTAGMVRPCMKMLIVAVVQDWG